MSKTKPRRIERQVTARDLAERLLPDLNMNELLLWAPDIFAYTSYIMSQTGTYQIVVSPPTGKRWAPRNYEIKEWLEDSEATIFNWLRDFLVENTAEKRKEINKGKNADKWIFDPENWKGEYFGSGSLSDWLDHNNLEDRQKKITFENTLKSIARDIKRGAIKSLKAPLFDKTVETIKRKRPEKTDNAKLEAKKELEKIKFRRPELKEFFIESKYEKFKPEGKDEEEIAVIEKYEDIIKTKFNNTPKEFEKFSLWDLLEFDDEHNWFQLVQIVGDEWERNLNQIEDKDFFIINDGERKTEPPKDIGELYKDSDGKVFQWNNPELKKRYDIEVDDEGYINREKDALGILLKHTPPLLLAIWAYFYNEVTRENFYGKEKRALNICELLCNQDHLQEELLSDLENLPEEAQGEMNAACETKKIDRLWKIAVALMTMHAIADICCTSWGLKSVEKDGNRSKLTAQLWAERLLFSKGSLSTINPERCRVIPKRHNPQVGITLRSVSSNLAFHSSSVEVVWRKTSNTRLEKYLDEGNESKTISLLLIPYPFEVKSKDFQPDPDANNKVLMPSNYEFFGYKTSSDEDTFKNEELTKLVEKAQEELGSKNPFVDIVVFPESALNRDQFIELQAEFNIQHIKHGNSPSLLIAGVRESRKDVASELSERNKRLNEVNKTKLPTDYTEKNINFPRNAVYCKYFDQEAENHYGNPFNDGQTPKYKQYKHHRWKLETSQIDRYGLSQILDDDKIWWESIKIPRRRVSFLNIGEKITVTNLICEDLARQDPIADLIRHVGPSLVVTLLMDGPQLRSRWSSRYASILADDPGSSVITLTSWGMVKRHSSIFGLMSRVVALWSESDNGILREIELAEGARAILLNLKLDKKYEKTADGRQERFQTTVLRLKDVIQIYPENS